LIQHLLLEQAHVRVAIIPALSKIRPRPATISFMDVTKDGGTGEANQRPAFILLELLNCWAVGAILMLPSIKMEHVQERDDVPVLIAIDHYTNFIEEELHVEMRNILSSAIVHCDLLSVSFAYIFSLQSKDTHATLTRNRPHDVLVLRNAPLTSDLYQSVSFKPFIFSCQVRTNELNFFTDSS
jgi:hypothetical protein